MASAPTTPTTLRRRQAAVQGRLDDELALFRIQLNSQDLIPKPPRLFLSRSRDVPHAISGKIAGRVFG